MRLGLAQINTTVGDLAGNRQRILGAYAALVERGAQLVVFPELATCGYPPRDLLFKRHFVPDVEESLRAVAAAPGINGRRQPRYSRISSVNRRFNFIPAAPSNVRIDRAV